MESASRWNPRAIPALLLALTAAPAADAATFLVGGDDCDFATIQPAIDAAAANAGFDTIRVAMNAPYTAQALRMDAQDVEIVGGFAACASATPTPGAKTTISGAGGAADSVLVILGSGERLLRNLAITGGDETDGGTGGGIDFQGSGALTLRGVVVGQNRAGFGGGISFEALGAGAALSFANDVVVQNNLAAGSGGGIRISGDARLFMIAPDSTVTGNEALGNVADSGYGGGIQVVAPARALIGSPGFGNIGAVAFNRAKFGGGIAVTARDDGDSDGTSAVLFTTDPLRPVRVHGNVASIAGGGAYLSENNDIDSTEETALCAYEFRIDDNRAPEGAAFFLDTDNALTVRAGAAARLNVSDTFRCGGVGAPPDPAARACATGVACNSIDGNVVQQANGQPATGAVVRLKENATIEGRRIAFTGNSGNDLMLVSANAEGPVPFHVDIRDCLVAGNQLTARLIAADTALIDSCTMAGNSLALSTLSITARAEIRNSIVWQPGFATLAPAPAVLAGSMLLSNDLVGLPGATDAPPRFIDPPRGDFRLRAASPAVDFAPPVAGDDRDLDGLPHDQDLPIAANLFGTRDLGAYERPTLLPLELNGTFEGDLNQWLEATPGITRFDPAENVSGGAGSGALELDYVNSPVVLARVAGRMQCVHLPGPGTYRLNGFARTSGSLPPVNVQSARLQWEFRRIGTEACSSGPADRSGDHVITSGSSFVQPASGAVIAVAPGEWTPTSSIAIATVVQSTGTTASPRLHAWFDGIRLVVDTAPPPLEFSDGFE